MEVYTSSSPLVWCHMGKTNRHSKGRPKDLFGKALVTFDELHPILLELEATINDRPLTYTSSDINEMKPITSSQLIRGRCLKSFPNIFTDDQADLPFNSILTLREGNNYMDRLLDHLWKQWISEYLLSLRKSQKRLLTRKGTIWPWVGDVVLIHDNGLRSKWKLGKITGLHPGWDGFDRVPDLKVASETTTRPIVKLFPLEQGLDDQSKAVSPADFRGCLSPAPHETSRLTITPSLAI